jgi:hypothetical protein
MQGCPCRRGLAAAHGSVDGIAWMMDALRMQDRGHCRANVGPAATGTSPAERNGTTPGGAGSNASTRQPLPGYCECTTCAASKLNGSATITAREVVAGCSSPESELVGVLAFCGSSCTCLCTHCDAVASETSPVTDASALSCAAQHPMEAFLPMTAKGSPTQACSMTVRPVQPACAEVRKETAGQRATSPSSARWGRHPGLPHARLPEGALEPRGERLAICPGDMGALPVDEYVPDHRRAAPGRTDRIGKIDEVHVAHGGRCLPRAGVPAPRRLGNVHLVSACGFLSTHS